jgi:hypothetical protein
MVQVVRVGLIIVLGVAGAWLWPALPHGTFVAIWLALFLPILAYVVTPLRLLEQPISPLDVAIVPTTQTDAYAEDVAMRLAKEGFTKVGTFTAETPRGSMARTLLQGERGEVAIVVVVHSRVRPTAPARRSVSFLARVEGHKFSTNNSKTLPAYWASQNVQLPGVEDVSTLLRIHRAHTQRATPLSCTEDPVAFLRELEREAAQRALDSGRTYAKDGMLRLTTLGAFQTVWRELPPARQIIMGRIHKRAATLLRG